MSYKISIIIPVYNVEFNIENCFLSLIDQSIGFENLEIICVDDSSTDNTRYILDTYSDTYDNIKVKYLSKNSGVAGKPRNAGLKMVTTDYVMFVDPDDTLYPNACEYLYKKISSNNADIVSGVHTRKSQHSLDEEVFPGLIANTFSNPNDSWPKRMEDIKKFRKEHPKEIVLNGVEDMPTILGNFGLSSKIFSLNFILENNISFPEYIPGEDSVFLFKCFLCANKIIFINKKIYSYTTFRDDEDNKSVSYQVDLEKNLGRLKSYKIMLHDSIDYNMSYEYVNFVLASKMIYFFKSFVIGKNISDEDLRKIFYESYELCKQVTENDVVPEKIAPLINNIVSKDYEKAIRFCNDFEVIDEVKIKNKTPYADELNVAVIMDAFTYNSFAGEFNAIALEPDNWMDKFIENDIDLLFVESAYHGVGKGNINDGFAIELKEHRPWEGKLAVNLNRGWDSRDILFKIVDYCKNNSIPTIFWNKEDPVSFHDKKYNFVDTALHFDYIFTTDVGIIPNYNAMGHENVYPLLFASQIKLFNPIEVSERSTDVIFPGSWYKKFPDRCNIMRNLFDKILDSKYKLKIYDRSSDLDIDDRFFPEKYHPYINPKVSFDKMPSVYKESKFSLNINTVTESYTMFARRVFELMSSNTFVLSNYSKGVYDLFKDNVVYLDRIDSLEVDEDDVNRICEENLYNILENHTYYERWKYILNSIGFEYRERPKTLTVIYFKEENQSINEIHGDFNKIKYFDKHLIIISNYAEDSNCLTLKEFITHSHKFDEKDYFIIRKISDQIDENFVSKALLHYKYLDNDVSIKNSTEKYTFNNTSDHHDLLFNQVNLDVILENILNYKELCLKVYGI